MTSFRLLMVPDPIQQSLGFGTDVLVIFTQESMRDDSLGFGPA